MQNGGYRMTVMLNSLKAEGEATMIAKTTDGYLFQTDDGEVCHDIFNPFVCEYYVDDLYTKFRLEDVYSKYVIVEWYDDYDNIAERYYNYFGLTGGKR